MKKTAFLIVFILLTLFLRAQDEAAKGEGNILSLKIDADEKRYAVEFFIVDGEIINQNITQKLKYEMTVKWLSKIGENYAVRINRASDIFVNDKASILNVASNLSVRASAAMYPLTLIVDGEGNILDIANHDEIQKRWAETKADIRKDFAGDGLDKYFQLNDIIYSQKDVLKRHLDNDRFIYVFFNDIYGKYRTGQRIEKTKKFPFSINMRGVEYSVKQWMKKTDDKKPMVEMYGNYTDKRSVYDIKNKNNFPFDGGDEAKGTYWATYYLDSKSHAISSAYASCTVEYDDKNNGRKAIISIIGRKSDAEKYPETAKIKTPAGKIYIPLHLYKFENEEIQGLLNPLIDIKDMTRPERKHEGIKIG